MESGEKQEFNSDGANITMLKQMMDELKYTEVMQ